MFIFESFGKNTVWSGVYLHTMEKILFETNQLYNKWL